MGGLGNLGEGFGPEPGSPWKLTQDYWQFGDGRKDSKDSILHHAPNQYEGYDILTR